MLLSATEPVSETSLTLVAAFSRRSPFVGASYA
jgi:hypothetical protein